MTERVTDGADNINWPENGNGDPSVGWRGDRRGDRGTRVQEHMGRRAFDAPRGCERGGAQVEAEQVACHIRKEGSVHTCETWGGGQCSSPHTPLLPETLGEPSPLALGDQISPRADEIESRAAQRGGAAQEAAEPPLHGRGRLHAPRFELRFS